MSGEGNVCPGGITYRQHTNTYINTQNNYGKFQSLQLTAIRPNDTHIYNSTIDA